MIYLAGYIHLPRIWKWDEGNTYTKIYKVTKNKTLELQFNVKENILLGFGTSLNFRQDHAGLWLNLNLFTFGFTVEFSDNRHWDDDNNCWEDEDVSA